MQAAASRFHTLRVRPFAARSGSDAVRGRARWQAGFVVVPAPLATDKALPVRSGQVPSMRSGTRITVPVAAAAAWIRSWLPSSTLPQRPAARGARRRRMSARRAWSGPV